MVPKGTPKEIVAQLSVAMKEVMQSKDVADIFLRIAVENDYRPTDAFRQYLQATTKMFSDVIKTNNIKLEN